MTCLGRAQNGRQFMGTRFCKNQRKCVANTIDALNLKWGERRTLVSRWFSLRIWGWKEGEGNQSSGSGIFSNKEKGQKYFLKNGNEWQRFQQVDTRFSHHHLEFQFITHTFTPTFSFFSSFFSPFFFLTTFPRSGEVMIQPLFRFRRRQGGGFFCVERHTKITKEMRQERERERCCHRRNRLMFKCIKKKVRCRWWWGKRQRSSAATNNPPSCSSHNTTNQKKNIY